MMSWSKPHLLTAMVRKIMLVIGLLTIMVLTNPTMANATTGAEASVCEDHIPTTLIVTIDPTAYPDPICLGCPVEFVQEEDTGLLTIWYNETERCFTGNLWVRVRLVGGEVHDLIIENVVLEPNPDEVVTFELPPGSDWAWDEIEVKHVLVRMDS